MACCLQPGLRQSVDLIVNQEEFPFQGRQEKGTGGNLQPTGHRNFSLHGQRNFIEHLFGAAI